MAEPTEIEKSEEVESSPSNGRIGDLYVGLFVVTTLTAILIVGGWLWLTRQSANPAPAAEQQTLDELLQREADKRGIAPPTPE